MQIPPGCHPKNIVLCPVFLFCALCAPKCPPWPPTQMEQVTKFLQMNDIAKYADAFRTHGYTSWQQILLMNNEQLEELSDKTGMIGDDFQTFMLKLQQIKSAPTVPQVPLIPEDTRGTCVKGLQTSYKTVKEVRLASLQHSTTLGCQAVLDYKKSGSRCKIYRCASCKCTKKRRRGGEEPIPTLVPCDHKLHWTFSKKKSSWNLNMKKSVLTHTPMCHLFNGGQKVSNVELQNDPEFISHVNTAKKVTGKTAAAASLGGTSHRMAGSVQDYTARRALNKIKQCTDKDYDQDWSKMAEWGREFERINPGGRFLLETESGRSVNICALLVPS